MHIKRNFLLFVLLFVRASSRTIDKVAIARSIAVSIVAVAMILFIGPATLAATTDPCVGSNLVSAEGQKLFCGGGSADVYGVINAVISWVMGIVGAIIVLIVIVAGVQLAASAGNPEAVKSAKSRLTNAIIGLVLLTSVYAIFKLIGIA